MSIRLRPKANSQQIINSDSQAATNFSEEDANIPVQLLKEENMRDENNDYVVPPRYVLNSDLKDKLQSFNLKRKHLKNVDLKGEYIAQLAGVLKLFDLKDDKYNHEIVLFCMEIAEEWVTDSKGGDIKKACVVNVCKKYFNNDVDLTCVIVELMMKNLKQLTFVKKWKIRGHKFFLSLLN
jgi:hypothetical protein